MNKENENEAKQKDSRSDRTTESCSALDTALNMIDHQAYLMKRQDELMKTAIERNNMLVKVINDCENENDKLRKDLKMEKKYGLFKLWDMI